MGNSLQECSFKCFYTLMTFGRLHCVMLDWFYCCQFPVGNSWHCSLFSIGIHFQQYCFLLDSCTVCSKLAECLLGWPPSFQSTNTDIMKLRGFTITFFIIHLYVYDGSKSQIKKHKNQSLRTCNFTIEQM